MTSQCILGKHLRAVGAAVMAFASPGSREQQGRAFSRTFVTVALALCATPLVAVAAFYFSIPKEVLSEASTEKHLQVSAIRLPDLRGQMAAIEANQEIVSHDVFVGESETLSSLFSKLSIRDKEAERFAMRSSEAVSLVDPKPGQFVTTEIHDDGTLKNLRMFQDGAGSNSASLLEIKRTGTEFTVTLSPYRFDTQLAMANGIVKGSVQDSLKASSIPPKIISQMHDAFDYDRDPLTHMQNGDAFRVIYEAKYADGNFVRYGRLLAMQLEVGGKLIERFWFNDGNREGNYFDANGNVSKRTFMRVPLDIKSVTSAFNQMRRHPITGVMRPHLGTDFRAPWGATVFAAADGVVDYAGLGTGFGKYIRIKHGPDCVTLYAHLSSIDPKIRKGVEVKHGEVIGKVGQTGLATGPHLHYELKIDNVQMNPMTAKLPEHRTLTPYQLAQMEVLIAPLKSKLALLKRVQVAKDAPSTSAP